MGWGEGKMRRESLGSSVLACIIKFLVCVCVIKEECDAAMGCIHGQVLTKEKHVSPGDLVKKQQQFDLIPPVEVQKNSHVE